MDPNPSQPLDLAYQLPRDTFHQVIHALRGALGPPVTDSPEDLIRRDNDAIARVASMLPASADEAHLAVQCVAAQVMALDCIRLARRHDPDTALALKCHAMSLGMMRQATAARNLLLRVQAIRQKREASNATLDQAAFTEHAAMSLMADALGRPPSVPIAQPQPAPPAPPPDAAPTSDLAAEAEQYAIIHPRRAALIRAAGGLPPNCDFGPPPPELLPLIAHGTTPHLRALDEPAKAAAAT